VVSERKTMTYLQTDLPDYLEPGTKDAIARMALGRKWGHLNVYTCKSCAKQLVTTDLDEGTTPFITRCRACGGEAVSGMYRVSSGFTAEPTHGWYRPESLDGLDAGSAQHVRSGGLILRVME
jgi:PHP family Zn ribbon phosphoesterase